MEIKNYELNGEKYQIIDSTKTKVVKSENYNSVFRKKDGLFIEFGKTVNDDPEFSPVGPSILDIEVSEVCSGLNGKRCKFCYKEIDGKLNNRNMSLEDYKTIIDKMALTLTSVAIGIGDIDGNKDLWDMMKYTREKGIVPNITVNGARLTDEYAQNLVDLCGAVSVSRYSPKDVCYNAVKKLTDLGLKQCNIHQLISHETIDQCLQVIDDSLEDERLKNLNAIVFLTYKNKNSNCTLHAPTYEDVKKVLDYAIEKGVKVGADSCLSGCLYQIYKDKGLEDAVKTSVISCESFGIGSAYVNVAGEYYPCSFAEGIGEWNKGIDVLHCEDFIKNVWYNEKLTKWREISIKSKDCNGCRKCLMFKDVNIIKE